LNVIEEIIDSSHDKGIYAAGIHIALNTMGTFEKHIIQVIVLITL